MAGGGAERRQSIRMDVPCPYEVRDPSGAVLGKGRTLNIGNGGMFLPMRLDRLSEPDTTVQVRFALPRSTPNTYMLEDFSAKARVLRHQPLRDANLAGVAVQFDQPIDLGLEV